MLFNKLLALQLSASSRSVDLHPRPARTTSKHAAKLAQPATARRRLDNLSEGRTPRRQAIESFVAKRSALAQEHVEESASDLELQA